jgi:hypothetical protein
MSHCDSTSEHRKGFYTLLIIDIVACGLHVYRIWTCAIFKALSMLKFQLKSSNNTCNEDNAKKKYSGCRLVSFRSGTATGKDRVRCVLFVSVSRRKQFLAQSVNTASKNLTLTVVRWNKPRGSQLTVNWNSVKRYVVRCHSLVQELNVQNVKHNQLYRGPRQTQKLR